MGLSRLHSRQPRLSEEDDLEHDHDNPELEREGSTEVVVRPEKRAKTPSFYKVIMLNDDFTPRDFVIHVLERFFAKPEQEATQIMLDIHHKGFGVAGVFTYEIAETKAYQCNENSKQNGYPLKCTVEKA